MSKNLDKVLVLCTCSKCKKSDIQNIGKFVHNSTKWRHKQKAKNWNYNFNISEEEIDRLYKFYIDLNIYYFINFIN